MTKINISEHERDEWTSLNVNEMGEVWTRQVLGLAVVWQQVIFKQVTHLFLVLLKHLYNYQVTFSVFYKIYRPSSYNKQNFYDNTNLFNCNWEWAQVCIKERPQAYHHSGPQVRTGKLLAKSSDHLTQESQYLLSENTFRYVSPQNSYWQYMVSPSYDDKTSYFRHYNDKTSDI